MSYLKSLSNYANYVWDIIKKRVLVLPNHPHHSHHQQTLGNLNLNQVFLCITQV